MQFTSTVSTIHRYSTKVPFTDGQSTTVNIVRYERARVRPRLIVLAGGRLLDWCEENQVDEAMVGGFFLRASGEHLGEVWIDGRQCPSAPILAPWGQARGSLYIDNEGGAALGARDSFPAQPCSLLQAGPLLVTDGVVCDLEGDHEGVSRGCVQFDDDITIGRFPRAAIGMNKDYIWSVVCDGRSEADAGMTLTELADVFMTLGADYALNLDGGGSATQISGGRLRNRPRGGGQEYDRGREIYSAIVFDAT